MHGTGLTCRAACGDGGGRLPSAWDLPTISSDETRAPAPAQSCRAACELTGAAVPGSGRAAARAQRRPQARDGQSLRDATLGAMARMFALRLHKGRNVSAAAKDAGACRASTIYRKNLPPDLLDCDGPGRWAARRCSMPQPVVVPFFTCWLIAVLIVGQIALGLDDRSCPKDSSSLRQRGSSMHKSWGMVPSNAQKIAVRLAQALRAARSAPPPETRALQTLAAGHRLLYALMLNFPWSGVLRLGVFRLPIASSAYRCPDGQPLGRRQRLFSNVYQ